MGQFKDLQGLRFGKLVVAELHGKNKGAIWLCKCDCGGIKLVKSSALNSGDVISCGCVLEMHGMSKTPEYSAYKAAKSRCINPKHECYSDYGGRGILFKFSSFSQFYRLLGPRPSEFHSLDRINNEGNYEENNVRWATAVEQMHNTRCNNCAALSRQIEELKDKLLAYERKI